MTKNNRLFFIVFAGVFCAPAGAWEIGVGVQHHDDRSNTAESARGVELRVGFGGVGDRYQDDRWQVAIGRINARGTGPIDDWIDTPFGCCALASELPPMHYANVSHRWYTLPRRQFRAFAAVGLAYRDVNTCVTHPNPKHESLKAFCWEGSAEVSSDWAFHLSFGFRWAEAIELAYDHNSTARISTINKGEDMLRLSFLAQFGR